MYRYIIEQSGKKNLKKQNGRKNITNYCKQRTRNHQHQGRKLGPNIIIGRGTKKVRKKSLFGEALQSQWKNRAPELIRQADKQMY